MSSRLKDICFDCADAPRVAHFWADVLGYTVEERGEGEPVVIRPGQPGMLKMWFNPVAEGKTAKNRVHVDVTLGDADEMERLLALGASRRREIRSDDGELAWTIMADVEGNEFCAFPPPGA